MKQQIRTRRHSTDTHRWGVVAICATSIFVVGLDTSIVNVALPSIGRDLDVGTRGLEWVVNAYTLVLASLLISSGAMADRFGRRRIFQLGLIVFVAASVACALAPSLGALIAARVVQGVGGSMLTPVALAIVVNVMTDPKERAKAIGVWAAVFGVSMAAGPLTGGLLIDGFGWRSVFWINVPVIAVILILTATVVPESKSPTPRRLDVPGQVLLTVIVGGAVAILVEGPHVGWVSPVVVIAGVLVVAALAVFVRIESRRTDPLIDPRLFKSAPFSAAVCGAIVVFVALNTTLLLGTLYLQQARGMSPALAGAVTLPMAVAATVCAPLAGILVGRVGPRLPLLIAGSFTALGGLRLILLDNTTGVATLLVAYLFIGIGFGFANAPITNTAVGGLPASRAGLAGGIASSARQFGAVLGVALAGGIIANSAPEDLAYGSRPGWMLVVGCGVAVLLVACLSPKTTP
ncbi:MFS transporter [Rhodococcus sp. 27YEA15]|uniref:MFS transporter n=1 Tax=Rhodococcus sp. 27YEA15 TaxID=3156259 RepID=UPI003C7A30A0